MRNTVSDRTVDLLHMARGDGRLQYSAVQYSAVQYSTVQYSTCREHQALSPLSMQVSESVAGP